MSAQKVLALYRLIFSALIVIASVQTLLGAQGDRAVLLLAGTEIAGAVILCWRPAQWLGAGLLLIVFGCAQVLSALHGDWPTRFLLYGASVLLIVTMDRRLSGAARA